MINIETLHEPKWQIEGTAWHLIIGNRSVAKVIPNFDRMFPKYKWLSVLADDYAFDSWHAVDFESLQIAKYDIEQWWLHRCRGEAFAP